MNTTSKITKSAFGLLVDDLLLATGCMVKVDQFRCSGASG